MISIGFEKVLPMAVITSRISVTIPIYLADPRFQYQFENNIWSR